MLNRFFGSIQPNSISLIFIGLMFLLPFISMDHDQPITTFYSEWVAAVMGLLAILPLLFSTSWFANQNQLKIPQISLIFTGLIVILFVQWALGMLHSNQFALLVLSYLVWAFFLTVLGSYLRRELGWERLVSTLAWSLVAAGIINIGIVVLQFVTKTGGVIPFLPDLPSYGALSQRNHFADFCALATASLIYLYAKARFSSSLFYLLILCFMMMLSFSSSRSVWLYLITITILVSVMHAKTVKQSTNSTVTRRAYVTGLILLPAFIIVQVFVHYVIPNELVALPTERLIDGVTAKTASVRLQFWYDSLRIFLESPWLGVGAGKLISNTILLLDTPTSMTSKRGFEHAHNLFLQILAEMGIGAFLIVSAGIISWTKAFKWRNLNLETWWLISLLSIISIHSMLEYPLWLSFFLGIVALLLGAGDEKVITLSISKRLSKFTRLSLISVWILGLANVSTLLIANIKLENWFQKMAYENVNDPELLNWVKQYSLLRSNAELMQAMSMTINSKLVDEQLTLNLSAMQFNPMRRILYQHALLLDLKGYRKEAVAQLNRSLLAYPGKFETVLKNIPPEYKQQFLDLYAEVQQTPVK